SLLLKLLVPDVEARGLRVELLGLPRVLELHLGDADVVLGLLVVGLVEDSLLERALGALEKPAGRLETQLEKRDRLRVPGGLLPRRDLLPAEGGLEPRERRALLREAAHELRAFDPGEQLPLPNRFSRLDGEGHDALDGREERRVQGGDDAPLR